MISTTLGEGGATVTDCKIALVYSQAGQWIPSESMSGNVVIWALKRVNLHVA